jgi:hypothetical protein
MADVAECIATRQALFIDRYFEKYEVRLGTEFSNVTVRGRIGETQSN